MDKLPLRLTAVDMLRIQSRTGIIIGESIVLVILSVSLGWYYYHVQNSLQYTGDPLYDPNGYQTMWIVGTPTNNGTFTAAYSSLGPPSNQTDPFSVQARMMNSYLAVSYAPCARWTIQNTTGPRLPSTCSAPAAMNMIIINSGLCLPSFPKPVVRESYSVQYHISSNLLYESGNTTSPEMTSVRFPIPAGDYCIIIMDTGQTDLFVLMNAGIEFTTV